ncbi:PocR ligand-binding domain-containing protein [Clostridium sp. OS1-26]|uniref:PocR ligand-binding domain-containing protein n=1 Tax=Clostridium sp. OS1-26 TaxID=3070681 RepID=UPI0027E1B7B3|nr:PocR ligand-binding domain-containing protein [Clostridium sp. OS1-26]WML35418.1 PocR ligand-binding domain-containing protein [Clostridium sp. OS1-26]
MDYQLSDLISIPQLQKLLDGFYTATGIATGIVSANGDILTATAWRDICTKFHRVNPKSNIRCTESDKCAFQPFAREEKIISYKCKNGLIEMGTPIIIEGKFIAIIYAGQLLFEEPDIEYFKKQAEEFGFNEKEYLKALRKVPVVKKKEYIKILQFLKDLSEMIGKMGLSQLKLLQAQKKLEISERRYRLALHGSNDGIWDINFLDNTVYFSQRFIEILGYSNDELKSLINHLDKIIHIDDIDSFWTEYYNHLDNKSDHFIKEVRIRTKWGYDKWVLVRGAATWHDNVPIRVAGSLTDLSNQKSAEASLKSEQVFSKAIMDYANVILCIFNSSGELTQFSKYAQELWGYSEKEVLGHAWMDTLCPGETGKNILNFMSAIDAKDNLPQLESTLTFKDGSMHTILWNSKALTNGDGLIKNFICSGLDITERKNTEKRLTEFFANISHELRTPLNIIFSSLQLIDHWNVGVSDNINSCICKKYTRGMQQNCYRLLRLVNNLIDITKIDAGYLELNMNRCNIVSLVEDITVSVAEYIESKNINLIFDTDIEEKIICCDYDKIERIVLNLLSNATKFTNPGGFILVTLQDKGSSAIISIKDTGIGIEKNKLEIIFERFKQVNKSFTRDHEGSGIGLSLVKHLVELHKGSIKVISEYGQGTEFIIELPDNLNFEDNCNKIKKLYTNEHSKVENIHIEFSDIYFN